MTRIIRLFAAVALTATAFAFSAQRALAADIVTQFTTANVSEVLLGMGATDVKFAKGTNGTESVVFQYGGGGTVFSIINCEAGKACRDLQMSIFFEKDGATYNVNLANSFNKKWLDATAVVLDDGTLMLTGIIIANGGVTKEHMKEVFAMFLNSPNLLAEQIKTMTTVSYSASAASVPASAVTGTVQRQPYVPDYVRYTRRPLRQYFR